MKSVFTAWQKDLPASVVVFFVALPLCLGIALASGAPLLSGLIAGIVGGIVVGAISNSALGVSGPAAGLTVIVLTAITDLGNYHLFATAVVLSGLIQLGLSLVRAGILAYYFPSAVIKGMLSGIGIIIFLKQLPHMVGYDADYEGDEAFLQGDGQNTLSELANMMDYISPQVMLVSVIALTIILLWDRIKTLHAALSYLQGPIVAVGVGILYTVLTRKFMPDFVIQDDHMVQVPLLLESGASASDLLKLPHWSGIYEKNVWMVALTLAVVASIETLLCVDATDKMDPEKRQTSPNRELLAQGAGNVVSGLIGGLPITQVIVRSSANLQSGAQSKLSAILHGFWLLISVLAIPGILNLIPLGVLAAVLLVVGYKLAKPSVILAVHKLGYNQFIPFVFTVIGVVFTDLLTGIFIGVVSSALLVLVQSFRKAGYMEKDGATGKIVIHLAQRVTFLGKAPVMNMLNKIQDGSHVVIDMRRTIEVDHDINELISDLQLSAKERSIRFEILK